MDIDVADTMPDGWQRWLDWQRAVAPDNDAEIKALEADRGSYLGYVRLVGRRNGQTTLADHIVSVPAQTYTKKPLLRTRGESLDGKGIEVPYPANHRLAPYELTTYRVLASDRSALAATLNDVDPARSREPPRDQSRTRCGS